MPAAAGTVPVTPLGPDEVLLELQVTGVSTLPAEVTTVSIPITRVAATPSAARLALAAEAERVIAGARRAGIEGGDIRVVPRDSPMGFLGPDAEAMLAFSAEEGAQKRRHVHGASVEITLRDPSRYESLRNSVETAETAVPAPLYSLRDPARGERAAKADGLRRARAEAEDFARSTGMRVGRLIRINAAQGGDYTAMATMMRMMRPGISASGTVETKSFLSVDFALLPEAAAAPRR